MKIVIQRPGYLWAQTFRIMKLIAVFLFAAFMQVSAKGYSQKVTLNLKDVTLEKVFKEIKRQSGYLFLYNVEEMNKAGKVSVNVKDAEIDVALAQTLSSTGLTFKIVDKTIVLNPKPVTRSLVLNSSSALLDVSTTIRGTVTDDLGVLLPGVTIMVKGSTQGTFTDSKGQYMLTGVDDNAVLIFSFIGHEFQTIPVKGRTTINVTLKAETKKLDETVIVGYGTTTKRKNLGSVSSITSEDIAKQPVSNVLNALQGRIPGAVITQQNGLPGSRINIQIRGRSSLDNGQQPLYIIDGVPFGIQDQGVPASNDLNSFGIFAANRGISPFSLINPADIERIDVLKDADATAIYGTRAANGVVLITTKKGKAGGTKVDVNIYNGTGKTSRFIDMMNTQQYLQLRREAYANDGITPTTANAPDLLVWDTTQNTDWQRKYLGGTSNITDLQTTVSGGDVRTRFLLGTGYHKETTVFPGNFNDTRYSVRFNADHNSLDRKFNANVSVNYSFDKSHLPSTDLANVFNLPPDMPLYKPDGTLFWNSNFTNPESYLLQDYYGRTSNLLSNAVLRYTILKGLDLKMTGGFNRLTTDQNQQQPVLSKSPLGAAPTNSARFATLDQQTYIVEPQAIYTRNIADGKLTALFGGTWQQTVNKTTSIAADNYSNPGLLGTLNGAGLYSSVTATQTLYKYNSFFSRIGYDWKSKYLVNGVIRRDGSSRFGASYRFGTFWSAGAGWIFSNEKFITDALPFLSFGKLRGSYGLTGSDQLQDYLYLTTFTASSGNLGYQGNGTLSPSRVNNPDLHWETNKKMEFGLDLGFLKDRIQLTADYYRNRTGNQLGFLRLSSQSGFNSYSANFDAVIENKGWEFDLNTINISIKDFEWKTSFNITVPTTKLLSASPQYFSFNQASLDQPLSFVLRYTYRGVDPATGRPLYRDATKDSVTFIPDFNIDRSIVGYSAPHFYGGFSNTFSYKGIELSFFFQFQRQQGNILTSSAPGILSNGNQNTNWLNRWRAPGDVSALPKATTTSSIYSSYGSSNAIWGDASFTRLRNATLSYSFPKTITDKIKMSNCRIYLQGQNLYTWTKNKYVSDPETIATTNQASVVSQPLRIFTFGINCSF